MSETLQDQVNSDESFQKQEGAGRTSAESPLLTRKVSVQGSVASENEVFADAVDAGSTSGDDGGEGTTVVEGISVNRTLPDAGSGPPVNVNGYGPGNAAAHSDSSPQLNGVKKPRKSSDIDPEAQAMVIDSLRSQVQDLFSQVTQLNNKLVQSYDRVSYLEDDLHMASSNIRTSSLKISQLELERTQHLAALNTGLLVERTHVTAELTRLMEKATEEAAFRGQAESARAEIEKDLDDLSASLFDQANTMVAEARLARAISERKVEEAEQALKGAEEAVAVMQHQMQVMQTEKERSIAQAEELKVLMGKGKWVERDRDPSAVQPISRLLSLHTPYQEFLLFVAHLRNIRPTSLSPPSMSSLLPLPFIARLATEDTDPTLRFDIAPSLNWLSRRSVLSAIHNGQLSIEPMSTTTLLQEVSFPSPGLPGSSGNSGVSCALCGTSIIPSHTDMSHIHPRPPQHPKSPLSLSRTNTGQSNSSSWSSFLPKNPLVSAIASAPPTPPARDHVMPALDIRSNSQSHPQSPPPTQLYVFRIATPAHSTLPGGPTSSHASLTITARSGNATVYPLCRSSWCLVRLRTTCSLWAFVKSGVVDKIWEEEMPAAGETGWEIVGGKDPNEKSNGTRSSEKPPVPPRRRGLWERASSMASSALGNSTKEKEKEKEKEKKLPATPPEHVSPSRVKMPPPPLPTRSRSRLTPSPTQDRVATPELVTSSSANGVSGSVEKPPALNNAPDDVPAVTAHPESDEPVKDSGEDSHEAPTSDANLSADSFPAKADATTFSDAAVEETVDTAAELAQKASESSVEPTASTAEAKPADISAQPTSTSSTDDAKTLAQPPALSNVQEAEKPPSRTGSPAPPPLPRRAAARARPVSVLVPPPAPSEENSAVTPQQTAPAESEGPLEPDENGDIAPSVQSKYVEKKEERHGDEKPEELKLSESSVPNPEEAESLDPKEQEESAESVTLEPPHDFAPVPVDGEEVSTAADLSDRSTIRPQDPEDFTQPISSADIKDSTTEEEGDSETGPFIGDATWEERTWKDIVRLKEDMFWARIGCIR